MGKKVKKKQAMPPTKLITKLFPDQVVIKEGKLIENVFVSVEGMKEMMISFGPEKTLPVTFAFSNEILGFAGNFLYDETENTLRCDLNLTGTVAVQAFEMGFFSIGGAFELDRDKVVYNQVDETKTATVYPINMLSVIVGLPDVEEPVNEKPGD